MRVYLTKWEQAHLSSKVAAETLTYMSHRDREGLTGDEMKKLERLIRLSDKLERPRPPR